MPKYKKHGIQQVTVPSERHPQFRLVKDSNEVERAEAVTLCNGINESPPPNSTATLQSTQLD